MILLLALTLFRFAATMGPILVNCCPTDPLCPRGAHSSSSFGRSNMLCLPFSFGSMPVTSAASSLTSWHLISHLLLIRYGGLYLILCRNTLYFKEGLKESFDPPSFLELFSDIPLRSKIKKESYIFHDDSIIRFIVGEYVSSTVLGQ
jgi:hypothetical protein